MFCALYELEKKIIIYNKKMEFTEKTGIYPTLPTAPPADSYRLQKINEIQRYLESESETREKLSKKYHRTVKVVSNVETALVATSMGLGVAGVSLLSTIIAAPIVIGMEVAALGTGLLGIVGGQLNKRLMRKAEKHEKIKTVADTKLNTISDLVSKALSDDAISDEEYTLILAELGKYRQMKEEVRSSSKAIINEEMRTSLINQGREEALDSIQKMFGNNRSKLDKNINTEQWWKQW